MFQNRKALGIVLHILEYTCLYVFCFVELELVFYMLIICTQCNSDVCTFCMKQCWPVFLVQPTPYVSVLFNLLLLVYTFFVFSSLLMQTPVAPPPAIGIWMRLSGYWLWVERWLLHARLIILGPPVHLTEVFITNIHNVKRPSYCMALTAGTQTTGAFPCLQITFVLRRDIGFFVIQVYMPTMMIVILSWVSFWINVDAIPARVSLGLLTVLTMTTMSTGANSSLPRVSYIKGIDIWMSMCLLFVFSALLEFAVVNVISRKRGKTSEYIRRRRRHRVQRYEVESSLDQVVVHSLAH